MSDDAFTLTDGRHIVLLDDDGLTVTADDGIHVTFSGTAAAALLAMYGDD